MSAKNYLGKAGLTELITNCNEELKKKLDQLDYYSESSETATLDPKTLDIQSSTVTITTPLRNTNATIDGVTGKVSLSSADTLNLGGADVYISGDPVNINDTTIVVDAHYATYEGDEIATVSAIPTATSLLTNDSGFITEEEIEQAGYVTMTELETGLSTKQDSLKYYSEGTNEATINTGVIALEAQSVSIGTGGILEVNGGKATYNAANIATEDDLSTKQNILTAGNGISIEDDTISCTYNDDIDSLKEAVSTNTNEISTLSDSLTDTKNSVSEVENGLIQIKQDVNDELSDVYSLIESKQDKLTAGTGIDITNNIISCTLDTTVFEIVETLPTSDIDTNKIYVVPAEHTEESNLYAEYIYVNNAWEKLGEFKADTDLSNYYTKSETKEFLDEKANSAEVYTKDEIDTLVYDKDYIDEITKNIQTELDSKLDELKYYTESGDNVTLNVPDMLTINSAGSTYLFGETYLNNTSYYKNAEIATVQDIEESVSTKQDKLKYYRETDTSVYIDDPTDADAQLCVGNTNTSLMRNDVTGIRMFSDDSVNITSETNAINLECNQALYNNKEIATVDDVASKQDALRYYAENSGSEDKGVVSLTANKISIDTNELEAGSLRIETGDAEISTSDMTISGTSVDITSRAITMTGDVVVRGSMYVNKGEVITSLDNIIYSTAVNQIVLVDALPSNPSSTTLYLIPE